MQEIRQVLDPPWVLAETPEVTRSGTLLGFDVGGTKVAVCAADAEGRILARRRRPTASRGDVEADVRGLVADARAVLAEAGLGPDEAPAFVGASVPGPLDADAEHVLRPPNLPHWDRLPLRRRLEEALGAPVRLENDANAAALAEWRFGAGRGALDLVYLTMSTGVGAGVVMGGVLQRGRDGQAGELGHVPAARDGEPCACGLRGCFEAYLGGAAWAERLAREAPADSRVRALGAEAPTPVHVFQAAEEGCAYALAELAGFNDILAQLCVTVSFAFAPERIVLGTIPSRADPDLCLEPVRRAVRERVWPSHREALRIEASELGDALPDHAGLAVALELRESRAG